jgi:hypothetical protein
MSRPPPRQAPTQELDRDTLYKRPLSPRNSDPRARAGPLADAARLPDYAR